MLTSKWRILPTPHLEAMSAAAVAPPSQLAFEAPAKNLSRLHEAWVSRAERHRRRKAHTPSQEARGSCCIPSSRGWCDAVSPRSLQRALGDFAFPFSTSTQVTCTGRRGRGEGGGGRGRGLSRCLDAALDRVFVVGAEVLPEVHLIVPGSNDQLRIELLTRDRVEHLVAPPALCLPNVGLVDVSAKFECDQGTSPHNSIPDGMVGFLSTTRPHWPIVPMMLQRRWCRLFGNLQFVRRLLITAPTSKQLVAHLRGFLAGIAPLERPKAHWSHSTMGTPSSCALVAGRTVVLVVPALCTNRW